VALKWVNDFFSDVDTVRIEKLAAWFADDIDLRFANNPAIHDKQTALHVLGEFFGTIAGMKHNVQTLVGTGDEVAQQAIVTYTRVDGRHVPLPVSSYLHRDGAGKLDRLWIYIDMNPLYAEAPAQ
jgi:ketosteroid isomerase-like protein